MRNVTWCGVSSPEYSKHNEADLTTEDVVKSIGKLGIRASIHQLQCALRIEKAVSCSLLIQAVGTLAKEKISCYIHSHAKEEIHNVNSLTRRRNVVHHLLYLALEDYQVTLL